MDRKNLVGPNVPTTPGNVVVWDAPDGAIVRDSGVPFSRIADVQPADLLALIAYAYRRIDFLEAALKVRYSPGDILVPDQIVLMEPYGEEVNQWT